jgi:hypothetical protein
LNLEDFLSKAEDGVAVRLAITLALLSLSSGAAACASDVGSKTFTDLHQLTNSREPGTGADHMTVIDYGNAARIPDYVLGAAIG